jgi:hypothetical protein
VQAEPNPIADDEAELPVSLVIVTFVDRLGLLEAEANISKELIALRHVLGDRRYSCLPWLVRGN